MAAIIRGGEPPLPRRSQGSAARIRRHPPLPFRLDHIEQPPHETFRAVKPILVAWFEACLRRAGIGILEACLQHVGVSIRFRVAGIGLGRTVGAWRSGDVAPWRCRRRTEVSWRSGIPPHPRRRCPQRCASPRRWWHFVPVGGPPPLMRRLRLVAPPITHLPSWSDQASPRTSGGGCSGARKSGRCHWPRSSGRRGVLEGFGDVDGGVDGCERRSSALWEFRNVFLQDILNSPAAGRRSKARTSAA